MYIIIKRFFDFTFSLLATLILFPLLVPIMIILALSGERQIFYLQERVGYRNRLFKIYKFATMLKNSPNMTGGLITLKKDPRLLPIGGFLRSSKINELPQLINILIGQMSFVGPRPVMKKSFEAYPKQVQDIIYTVTPGLTGIGSIVFRDEENLITSVKEHGGDTWKFYTTTIYPYKGQLEAWYKENQSFFTDIKIIILTAISIIFPNNQLVYKWFPTIPKRNF